MYSAIKVVTVSPCNPQSVSLVETKLKGLIIQLDDDAQIALENINRNHSPLYKKLDPVSHGGETFFPRIWSSGSPLTSIQQ